MSSSIFEILTASQAGDLRTKEARDEAEKRVLRGAPCAALPRSGSALTGNGNPARVTLGQVMTNLVFPMNFLGCFMEKKVLRNKASCWKLLVPTFTLY